MMMLGLGDFLRPLVPIIDRGVGWGEDTKHVWCICGVRERGLAVCCMSSSIQSFHRYKCLILGQNGRIQHLKSRWDCCSRDLYCIYETAW